EGRSQHAFLDAGALGLCAPRGAARPLSLSAGVRRPGPWPDGQADAGDLAVCFAAARLLAVAARPHRQASKGRTDGRATAREELDIPRRGEASTFRAGGCVMR